MAAQPSSGGGADTGVVELLSDVATERAGAAGATRRALAVPAVGAVVVLVALGLVALVAGPRHVAPRDGRVVALQFRFEDPFEIDWIELPATDDGAVARGPQPMVGDDGRCIGFGRSDWPAGRRHPSVAHCLDADSVDRLGRSAVVGVHRIAAGRDTWHFLFLGSPVIEVSVDVDEPAGSEAAVEPRSVHRAGSVAAVLVPTSAGQITVGWMRPSGDRYLASIG